MRLQFGSAHAKPMYWTCSHEGCDRLQLHRRVRQAGVLLGGCSCTLSHGYEGTNIMMILARFLKILHSLSSGAEKPAEKCSSAQLSSVPFIFRRLRVLQCGASGHTLPGQHMRHGNLENHFDPLRAIQLHARRKLPTAPTYYVPQSKVCRRTAWDQATDITQPQLFRAQ
jgi:hypothetical protein